MWDWVATLPENVLMVIGLAIAGFILMFGVKVYRAKHIEIKTPLGGELDIESSDTKRLERPVEELKKVDVEVVKSEEEKKDGQ